MPETSVDLSKLALNRSPEKSTPGVGRPKKWLSRYVFPAGILLVFLAILTAAAGRSFVPATSVTVMSVLTQQGEVQQAGTPLFQAAGWIEPRPTAIRVAALTGGIVEELLVVEGDRVEKAQPIARLISIDSELAVEQAQNNLMLRQGELQRAQAEEAAARVRLEKPVHLQASIAEAESRLAKVRTEINRLPFQIDAAQARLEFATQNRDGKRAAREAIAARILQQAESQFTEANANLEELLQSRKNLEQEMIALQQKVTALTSGLELLVEEKRQLKEAEAKVISADAQRKQAEVELRMARITLERCQIKAPVSGRILKLVAFPGSRVLGMSDNGMHSSSTVVEMYDPDRLQVRADVRLEDVPRVIPGAPVEIETASSKKKLKGRVLQPTSTANIQKNTLEVKVELLDPEVNVRPEMLVTATFLSPETNVTSSQVEQVNRILIPKSVIQSAEQQQFVWIVDSRELAHRQSVSTGNETAAGLIEVTEGLNLTDKLIYPLPENLEEGDSVTVTGEDHTLGMK
ncbi:Type I secretion system membrane fusion protein PrsE [Polystyrenella longa]|uniref:Type I secretion system membrane fusion protein PrsE n=1 Tax=Polystyrenella longa TaxID=2528007 RepID=A0A518CSW1_9PLAN|nr:efflux RND transporter periplasmic adaptor subunit [Polystyrenella longa]QDU82317.1 Type I secretion system membrane fusion protein PrsE [Polystyrenella longa]